jgi:uncharacterized protein (UPF0218 family)
VNKIFLLNKRLRKKLKQPLGLLISGIPEHTMNELKNKIIKLKPKIIISVGDEVTKNILTHNIPLNIAIIDGKIMRKTIKPIKLHCQKTYIIKNTPGTLSYDSFKIIKKVIETQELIKKEITKIFVKGEEDLLTLLAVFFAPIGSLITYGQPCEGIVIIYVNKKIKEKVKLILKEMRIHYKKNVVD